MFIRILKKILNILCVRFKGMMMASAMISLYVTTGLVFAFLKLYTSMREHDAKRLTKEKIAHVAHAIRSYARMHGYLPYPAQDLNGEEMEMYDTSESVSDDKMYGHIPYKALNLDKQYAFDGFNRPLRYVASTCICRVRYSNQNRTYARYSKNLINAMAFQNVSYTLLLSHTFQAEKEPPNYDVFRTGPYSYIILSDNLEIDIKEHFDSLKDRQCVTTEDLIPYRFEQKINEKGIATDTIIADKYKICDFPAFIIIEEKNLNHYRNVVKPINGMYVISRFQLANNDDI